MDRTEKTIVSLTCTGHTLTHMYMLIVPVLLTRLMDQFRLSLVQITSMWTMCYFLYGIVALPAGFLADKWSCKAVLVIFFIGTPTALLIIGTAQSVLSLGIGMALLGLFASLYHPSGLAMISHSVRERGKALGLQGVAGNLGLAFSPVIVGILASRFSWRYACYILSFPSFIAVIAFLISRAIKIERRELLNSEVKLSAESIAFHNGNKSERRLTIWAIILLYVAMAVAGFTYQGMTTMLPTYLDSRLLFSIDPDLQSELDSGVISENLKQKFKNRIMLSKDANISIKKANSRWQINDNGRTYSIRKEADKLNIYTITGRGKMFTTMVLLVGVLGQYMGGYLSDRHRKTRLYLLFNSASLPFMILVGFMAGIPLILVAAMLALFHFAGQPVENSLIAQYTSPRLRSSGYGLKFVFTFGVGSFASVFSGYIGEYFGLSSVFIALGCVIFLMILFILLLNVMANEAKPRV